MRGTAPIASGFAARDRSHHSLPILDSAGDHPKERMCAWSCDVAEFREPIRIAGSELSLKVMPLVLELAAIHGYATGAPVSIDFRRHEGIAAGVGFRQHDVKVHPDAVHGSWLGTKAIELRVAPIALRPPAQYRLSEQGFPPDRDQAPPVEVTGVQAPESHAKGRPGPTSRP